MGQCSLSEDVIFERICKKSTHRIIELFYMIANGDHVHGPFTTIIHDSTGFICCVYTELQRNEDFFCICLPLLGPRAGLDHVNVFYPRGATVCHCADLSWDRVLQTGQCLILSICHIISYPII